MKTVILLSTLLVSCAPFIESNKEATKLGISINHREAESFIFNLFSRPESVILVNEKR